MLDPELAAKFAADDKIDGEVAQNSKLREVVQVGIDAANARLSRVEQIKKFTIVGDTWLPGGEIKIRHGSRVPTSGVPGTNTCHGPLTHLTT